MNRTDELISIACNRKLTDEETSELTNLSLELRNTKFVIQSLMTGGPHGALNLRGLNDLRIRYAELMLTSKIRSIKQDEREWKKKQANRKMGPKSGIQFICRGSKNRGYERN